MTIGHQREKSRYAVYSTHIRANEQITISGIRGPAE